MLPGAQWAGRSGLPFFNPVSRQWLLAPLCARCSDQQWAQGKE